MLRLKAECIEPLQNFLKTRHHNRSEIVTCIFGDHIQFEKLDETQLLPKDVMRIVHEYFDDKMIINCSYDNGDRYNFILFDISDDNNKIIYHYHLDYNMLVVQNENFNQKDNSIMIISSSVDYFNLLRLYSHCVQNDDPTFKSQHGKSTVTIDNNKYTIVAGIATYVSLVLDHEILQRRIDIMKQLIDIIKKLQ